MLPIPVIALGLLGAGAFFVAKKMRGGKMTPERRMIFEAALRERDGQKLLTLADAFEKEGLIEQATMLRKRARLRNLPPEVKQARRDAFKKLLASDDKDAVLAAAKAYEDEGATGAAAKLRAYAEGLQ
jgi:hypothetical protein